MESPRESKRRRLDTPSKQSSTTKASPASRNKSTPRSALTGTPASRAKQARAGLSPYSQSKENAQPPHDDPSDTTSGAPQTALEKLRAKKQAKSNGENDNRNAQVEKEPETPSKAKSMAGFFKKFADPLLVSLRANGRDRESSEEANSGADAAEDLSDGDSAATSVRASGRKKQLSTKLREQAEAGKPKPRTSTTKKTFEDEIRELEAAARVEAGAEEADNATPAKQAGGRRAGSRIQTPKEKAGGTTSGTTSGKKTPAERRTPASRKATSEKKAPTEGKAPGTGTPAEKKPRGRPRKNAQPEPEEKAIVADPVPEILVEGDAMEIDNSEDDRDELAIEATPPRPIATPQKKAPMSVKKPAVDLTKLPHIESTQLEFLQRVILEKIHGKRPIPLTNLGDEYSKVNTVISQTITVGESNSMLLIGGRGSGKTTLVNHILREQADERPDDFHVVRLNGFVHTDDKIALREIWRQLGREMELDEEENTTRNYADTLASLLALLSHPIELGQEQAPGQTNKSVIFILDEFDLFASHPRQTLLYNLFDIAQSRKAPIAVLGLTTRIDVAESLEKRVKSRFSHRYVHLSSSKSFPAFVEVCKAALAAQETSLSNEERAELAASGEKYTTLDTWNAAIDSLMSSDKVEPLLRRIYYTTKSVPEFLAAFLIPLTTLPPSSSDHACIQNHILTNLGSRFSSPDSKMTILATLSTLQLALLICAARQTAIHATDTVSFNLAYEEYKVLASKAKIQAAASGAMGSASRVWSKEVAKDAWMSLIDVGLVMEDGYSGRGGGAAGRVDVSLEEIGESGIDLGSWGRWCKEI